MKQHIAKWRFFLGVIAVAGALALLIITFLYVGGVFISENQQDQMRSPTPSLTDGGTIQSSGTASPSITSSHVNRLLKTLPNLTILADEDVSSESKQIAHPETHPTAIPARALFKYQANDASDTHFVQSVAVESLQAMFADAANKNYPLKLSSGYKDIESITLSSEPPAGYNLRHTGYAVSLSCGDVAQQQFSSSICYSWLMRNNATIAREFGLLPLQWLNDGSTYEYNDYDFLWVGNENLRDINNVIE